MEVRNRGNKPINNIKLSVEPPEGWIIDIKPAEIVSLSAGSLYTVDVNIRPVGGAARKEYEVTFVAEATETRQVNTFMVTVEPTSLWLWVWAGVGVLVIAGFVLIYLRFGRK